MSTTIPQSRQVIFNRMDLRPPPRGRPVCPEALTLLSTNLLKGERR